MRRRRWPALAAGLALLAAAVAACTSRSTDPHTITVWTADSSPTRLQALHRIIDGFQRANPGYRVELTAKPTLGVGDATNLITAVRGHTGPDVYLIDRFGTAQYAATDLLEDLQPYADTDPTRIGNYLDFARKEGTYRGDLYSVPVDVATNAVLYYNKDMLRRAGVDPAVLDPAHGPPTVAEVIAVARRMDRTGANGAYTQMGLVPWSGQGFWAAWSLMHGARFYDPHRCAITATEPALLQTFTDFARWAKQLDYRKADTFTTTYQPPGAPAAQSLFYSARVGMQIDGNWGVQNLKLYAPKLHYGVTYFPVQHRGDPPFSWSGGWAMAIPRHAANADGGWKFITYATGPPGQRISFRSTGLLPAWAPLLHDRSLIGDQEFFARLLERYTTSRPPLPVMGQYSTILDQAQSSVLLGSATPRTALERVNRQMQGVMQQYCPFRLP